MASRETSSSESSYDDLRLPDRIIKANNTPSVEHIVWAKTAANGGFHPLICHSIDALAVAEYYWVHLLGDAERKRLSNQAGIPISEMKKWFIFLVGSHDIGKASPGFQSKWSPGQEMVESLGFKFGRVDHSVLHGTVTTNTLSEWLEERGSNRIRASEIACAIGSHHGTRARKDAPRVGRLDPAGNSSWKQIRSSLLGELADLSGGITASLPNAGGDALLMALAGCTSFLDWIASMEEFFPAYQEDSTVEYLIELDTSDYFDFARKQAKAAFKHIGFFRQFTQAAEGRSATFSDLFPHIETPHSGQKVVDDLLTNHKSGPFMLVVEDATGAGKTESSFVACERALALGARGLYLAMPTQATSDQTYRRLLSFLETNYATESLDAHLLHGNAFLNDDRRELTLPRGVWDEDAPTLKAGGWFAQSKRGLLGANAVGTVDQALMGVLRGKHHWVRLWGLANRCVVLDEVHAYDVYTGTLIERLLEWLGALGSPVVLLSATLPNDRRQRLLDAYRKGAGWDNPVDDLPGAGYPRVSFVTEEASHEVVVETPHQRTINIDELLDDKNPGDPNDLQRIAELIKSKIFESGVPEGNVFWICNTVARAQRAYSMMCQMMENTKIEDGDSAIQLLTSRMRMRERGQREQLIKRRYGPPTGAETQRPSWSILIATQIVEQSLDVDADWIVTDACPMDLLLQRAGRLQRHTGRKRPEAFREVRVQLTCRIGGDDPPIIDSGTNFIYSPSLLLRTLAILGSYNQEICIPEDVDPLVQETYSADVEILPEGWRAEAAEADQALRQQQLEDENLAKTILVGTPSKDEFCFLKEGSVEHDDNVLEKFSTRKGDRGYRIILLHPDEYDLVDEGGAKNIKELMMRILSIPTRQLKGYEVAGLIEGNDSFRTIRQGTLDDVFVVLLDKDGIHQLEGGRQLRYSNQIGLEILE